MSTGPTSRSSSKRKVRTRPTRALGKKNAVSVLSAQTQILNASKTFTRGASIANDAVIVKQSQSKTMKAIDALIGPYDPQTPTRLVWDCMAILLVTYDAFLIP